MESSLTAAEAFARLEEAQAFKRACSLFGLGGYFYKFDEMWVDLNECRQPKELPPLPAWALPESGAPIAPRRP